MFLWITVAEKVNEALLLLSKQHIG